MKKHGCPAGQVWFRGKCVEVMYKAQIDHMGHSDDILGYGKTPGEALRMCKKAHAAVLESWRDEDEDKNAFLSSLEEHQRDFAQSFEYYDSNIETIVPGYSEHDSWPVDDEEFYDASMLMMRKGKTEEDDVEWVRRKLKER